MSNSLSSEKLQPLTRTIAHELYRLLTTIHTHHNMVHRVKCEYLNLVEKKVHTPTKSLELHLFDVSLNYYKYIACNLLKQKELEDTIELICYELLSSGVFKRSKTKSKSKSNDPLLAPKQWILQKYFMFIEHLKEIHNEHSESQDVNTLVFLKTDRISDEEIASWNDLYT
jgi:predicted nucleic-acid-binding Zn-ribbon protein